MDVQLREKRTNFQYMRWLFFMALFVTASVTVNAQDETPILLNNPSFEGTPISGEAPSGWFDCGFPGESPPDVQPADTTGFAGGPFFKVTMPAQQGKTYLGMVFRDNDTWEMVSQRLSKPLKAGKCYEFSIHLARSKVYVSLSRKTGEPTNYTTPGKFRIWGGRGYCQRMELLAQTPVIKNNTRFVKYDFKLKPTKDVSHIVFEAYYDTPVMFPTNGNILVDNASAIIPVPCDDELPIEDPIADNPDPVDDPDPVVTKPVEPKPDPVVETEPNEIAGIDRKNLRVGQTIRIEKLYFDANSYEITPKSFAALDELFDFLKKNQDIKIEIGGHTNSTPSHQFCDELSTNRAKATAQYLIDKGVDVDQLAYKGYGKRKPLVSNKTEAGRRKNQRVEIKILSTTG